MNSWKIGAETLEFFDDGHIYLVDGIVVPSITQILNVRFGAAYANVPPDVLKRAAERGTMIHAQIENFIKTGEANEFSLPFSQCLETCGLHPIDCEIPVILHENGNPVAAGRLDLLLGREGKMGIADIKTTKKLNTDYLFYQLNLYRIAFMQSYNSPIEFLGGVHLRESAKYAEIEINENKALEIVTEWRKNNE